MSDNARSLFCITDFGDGERGGVVVVPAGTFVTGTLFVRGNTTLRIETGAVLQGSRAIGDYPPLTPGHNKDRQRYHLLVRGSRWCGEGISRVG